MIETIVKLSQLVSSSCPPKNEADRWAVASLGGVYMADVWREGEEEEEEKDTVREGCIESRRTMTAAQAAAAVVCRDGGWSLDSVLRYVDGIRGARCHSSEPPLSKVGQRRDGARTSM